MTTDEALELLHQKGWYVTLLYEHRFQGHSARTWICTVLPEQENFEFIRAEAESPSEAIARCVSRLGEALPRTKFDWTKVKEEKAGLKLSDLEITL